jgi:hypothetical protein
VGHHLRRLVFCGVYSLAPCDFLTSRSLAPVAAKTKKLTAFVESELIISHGKTEQVKSVVQLTANPWLLARFTGEVAETWTNKHRRTALRRAYGSGAGTRVRYCSLTYYENSSDDGVATVPQYEHAHKSWVYTARAPRKRASCRMALD